jgi:hypothetical protein
MAMQMDDFNFENLTQVLWAFATLKAVESPEGLLYSALERWPYQLAKMYEENGGRNALTKHRQPPPRRSAKLLQVQDERWRQQQRAYTKRKRLPNTFHKNIGQLCFAYAKSFDQRPTAAAVIFEFDIPDEATTAFMDCSEYFIHFAKKLEPQQLSNVLWCYAKLGTPGVTLSRIVWALYPIICSKLSQFPPQVCNSSRECAFATFLTSRD